MQFGNFKVFIQERPASLSYRIFLYTKDGKTITHITKDGAVKTSDINGPLNDDELYFADMTGEMLQAFAEALASQGIKTNKDSVAEGKLLATERHLDDMRTIALAKYKR